MSEKEEEINTDKDTTQTVKEEVEEVEQVDEISIVEKDSPPVDEEISAVDELETLKEKVVHLEDKYIRVHADFENMSKRLEKEKQSAVAYANELFARDMLPVIDALDAASLLKEGEDIKPEELFEKVKEGINLTVDQFKKSFEKHGIEVVHVDGDFDPNFHNAVMQVDSEDKKSGEILQVFQKGYKIKDRVLRPAMVSTVK
ncbi:MAG: nucleotide exchange factor GrpE [Sulfurospirillum sp.]|nr:nucleotide exchange factor GrpE [Sulfurospirillum sp.]MBL0703713.1 nucleotide exchange factor GrpE [Sulfurospirillum sp.]